ncbi:MAG TPA: aldo/keto reductase [Solirubrobacter sp.]|jgi:aryl-alcohol dehydrogenase-like predicted oxidoreductase|nr:aldo/keto reductase [Solirubrobacter sp.]
MADPSIESRPLGRSGLEVPRIMLGCGNFGGVGSAPEFFGQGIDEDGAFALMDAAWEMGLRHFDTADAYGGGRSEAMIGRWCAARGVRPAITTKTFNPMNAGAEHGLAPARIERQLAASLERLGTDHVELYLAHEYDPDVPLEDTFAAFEAARAEGSIGAYGASNFNAEQLARAVAAGAPACVQNAFSLLDRADEGGVLGVCATHGVAYAGFGPLAGGWLTGKYRRGQPFPSGSRMTQRPEPYAHFVRDGVFDALETLERVARERGVSMAGLALAWLLGEPRLTSVVVGPTRPEHLEPVREALANPLDAATRDELSRVFS